MTRMKRETPHQEIKRAFADVPLPRERVAPHFCGECDEIVDFLQGRTRESLTQADMWVFGETRLHLISAEALHYYFPRILEKALRTDEAEFLSYVLCFLGSNSSHTTSQVALFTDEQRQVISRFLLFIKTHRYENVVECLVEDEMRAALNFWA